MKKTIVIASNNEHKLKEFKEILTEYNIVTLNDISYYDDIEETGTTFEENALIKAQTIHKYLKSRGLDYIVIADDSGLCVESLNGAPGVYSARYAGGHGDNEANRSKLQQDLIGKERDAYFICTIVVVYTNGEHKTFEGKTFGKITEEELGKKDFGYDCIFYSNDLNKTFGEATEEEKNSVSHRGRAIKEMIKWF
ncbi:MAG: RdgB/HAM1 family non-canonical purine NTP pyrophosphatase [Clostridia bacterium]|nr:RdgB/HAM1 family non-canonical purine NTP pyrophosphatase [Clostridia bacterium]